MKNIKYLGFIGLGCSLLLTGCGGSSNSDNSKDAHSLICTITNASGNGNYEFKYNDKEDTLIGVEIDNILTIPDDASEDDVEYTISRLNEGCEMNNYKCDVSRKGNKIEAKISLGPSNLKGDDMYSLSKEEMKEKYENEGYTCK